MSNNRKKRKLICVIIFLCLISFFYLLFNVISGQKTGPAVKSDAIVVLGHSLEDGNLPGEWLTGRLEAGLELYNEDMAPVIIVTGGEGPSDNIAVAESMKNWLVENGAEAEDIFVEENASNTYENFKYVKSLADDNDIEVITVVTNDFHIYRSRIIGQEFFNEIKMYSADTEFGVMKLLNYIKEPVSLMKYFLFDRGR